MFPLKVRCIIHKIQWYQIIKRWYGKKERKVNGPANGDVVTATSEYYKEGIRYYKLKEWPPNGYDANAFVPLDEQAEPVTFEKVTKEHPVSVN